MQQAALPGFHRIASRWAAWRRPAGALALLLALGGAARPAVAETPLVAFDAGPGVVLADARGVARVVTDPRDHAVVRIAAADLSADLARVSGTATGNGTQIWLGTLGRSAAIDGLVRRGLLDVRKLRGAWESFVIATVDRPAPGVTSALVIVGSDRRGTAFGAYELSRAIGVSPWHWWADVTPEHHALLRAPAGVARFGPPSVKYRGVFLNDEDWGLQPWAAHTFEPAAGTIGLKTYAKLFEMMLRLKANLVWPAMHKVTRPFNADPGNAALADRYAIVMGSSHAEPMLRNNVGEWTAPAERFNYATNAAGVARYWRERVATNARYESAWTLGMRGIHDSGMVGPSDDAGRRTLLERIFADQRAMLPKSAPQVFTPYKEVLDVYRSGLKVPRDVTLLWPDDNFGYIRHLPDTAERQRPGGSGVYYHLSYLGAPLSYLWLSTTPPALIREELGRAWDAGARQMWVANVGDLKPGELATDYFLRLAWDVPATRAQPIDAVMREWAAGTLGADVAADATTILAEHHRLNFARRPEHLQWWLPGELSRPSPLSPREIATRLAAFDTLAARVRALAPRIAADRRDAFFELVDYPVTAAALANVRLFDAEAYDRLHDSDPAAAAQAGARARAADAELTRLTRRYNETIAGGKWRGMLAMEPADGQWRRLSLDPADPARRCAPPGGGCSPTASSPAAATAPVVEAEAAEGARTGWRVIDGLGRNGAAVGAALPAQLSYTIDLPRPLALVAELLPTYATRDGDPLRLTLALDDAAPVTLAAPRVTGDAAWARAVLDNRIELALPTALGAGRHRFTVGLADPALILDRFRFDPLPASLPPAGAKD